MDAPGGEEAARRVFGTVLTDNGPEFSDEDGIAALLGERPGEMRPFCCDPMRSDQKGACEKNHVEIRKLAPKGRGYRLDRLEREDAALLTSQINSTPRGALAFMSPIQMFRAPSAWSSRAGSGSTSPRATSTSSERSEAPRPCKAKPSLKQPNTADARPSRSVLKKRRRADGVYPFGVSAAPPHKVTAGRTLKDRGPRGPLRMFVYVLKRHLG